MTVLAVSVRQPFASLVARRIVTALVLPNTTSEHGRVAIYAEPEPPAPGDFGPYVVRERGDGHPSARRSELVTRTGAGLHCDLPLGALVATAYLREPVSAFRCSPPGAFEQGDGTLPINGWDASIPEVDDGDDTVLVSGKQWELQDYRTKDTYAWLLEEICPLIPPVRVRGGQERNGLLEFDVQLATA